jgi:hypothetical protein
VPQGLDDDVDEAVVLALVVLQPLLAIGQLLRGNAAHHWRRTTKKEEKHSDDRQVW